MPRAAAVLSVSLVRRLARLRGHLHLVVPGPPVDARGNTKRDKGRFQDAIKFA